jgi:pimeloyl-ACP methyl ester carboxylesterase
MLRTRFLFGLLLAASGCADVEGVHATDDTDSVVQEIRCAPELRDRVFTYEHYVPVGDGVRLHVVEKFSNASVQRREHRALLMLTGTFVTNAQYNAEIPGTTGYNALERAAREGYYAFAASYEGYGESSHPADGRTVTATRLLGETGRLIEWIRTQRNVRRVDLLGASLGSSLAVALGGTRSPIDRNHVGRIVVTSMVYKSVTPLLAETLFNPETRAALESIPGGYVPTGPEMYGLVFALATPQAQAWAFGTFPGLYAVGPTLEGFDLPVFEARDGRAPLLQIWGDQDPITPRADVDRLQREYGGRARLVVLRGAGHSPPFEASRERFWEQTFDFLDD